MLRDHQLLIRRNDIESNAALRLRYEELSGGVRGAVERNPEPCELVRNARTHRHGVFADSGGEHEGVKSAESGGQHAGIEPDTIRKVLECKGSLRVGARLKLAHVIAQAGETLQSAFMIE